MTLKRLLKEREMAERAGVGTSTARKWRLIASNGGPMHGPPWVRVGPSQIRYLIEAVDAWIDSVAVPLGVCEGKRTSTSGAEATRRSAKAAE